METSSSSIPKSFARLRRSSRIRAETISRFVMSSDASNCATIAFSTSLPIEGRTRSS